MSVQEKDAGVVVLWLVTVQEIGMLVPSMAEDGACVVVTARVGSRRGQRQVAGRERLTQKLTVAVGPQPCRRGEVAGHAAEGQTTN